MMSCKLWILILAIVCVFVFPGASVSLAVLVPPGTPILIVDGIGDIGNTTVVPTVMAFPVANGFEFGQASGGIFSPIMSGVTALAGGSLVDFAIHEIGKPFTSFASLTAQIGRAHV